MGLSPRQVDDLSMWEFSAIVDGFNSAHDSGKNSNTQAEFDQLSSLIDSVPITTVGLN